MQCRVRHVEEYYLDLYALGADYWTLDTHQMPLLSGDDPKVAARIDDGLFACCMALRTFSPCIRFSASSRRAQAVASSLATHLDQADFDRGGRTAKKERRIPDTDLVLVLDRMDDVRTALLVPWTYAAMLHEFLGNTCNVVAGDDCLAPDTDPFFVSHQYARARSISTNLLSCSDHTTPVRVGGAGTLVLPRWRWHSPRA